MEEAKSTMQEHLALNGHRETEVHEVSHVGNQLDYLLTSPTYL